MAKKEKESNGAPNAEKVRDAGKQNEVNALKERIGGRFFQLREQAGLVQEELAADLGVSQNLVYRLENGSVVSLDSVLLAFLYFSKKLQVNPEWLFAVDNSQIVQFLTPDTVEQKRARYKDARRAEIMMNLFRDLSALDEGATSSTTINAG